MTFLQAGTAIFAVITAANCAQLSLPASAAAPGGGILLPVTFASQSSSITAIQFDLQYDSTALSLCATAGESARASKKTVYLWELAPGQRRFLIVGHNSEAIVDGALIDLFVSLSSTAPDGVYALTPVNVVATDPSAQAVTLNAAAGSIAVQGAARQVLTLTGNAVAPALPSLPRSCPAFSSQVGANVLFDGIPAPLLYAASDHSSGISHGLSAHLPIPVAAEVPSIFTLDGSGVGPGAILNRDYSVNSPSNPAERGAVVRVFANGLGRTNSGSFDGQAAGDSLPETPLTISVQIAGGAAQVLYAGAAPGLVDGVLQVNCIVPLDSPPGDAVPILLYAGKTRSPAGVTLAIR
jgi:Cohesin domain